MQKDEKAITLIALIITIIVMLILVGVTVNVAINGGLFSTAKKATAETQHQADREMLLSAVIGAMNDNAEVDFEKLDKNLPQGFTKKEDDLYESRSGNAFYVNKEGNIIKPVVVTVDKETVMITPKNLGKYLGKEVTNYKKDSNTNETITIGTETYTVSAKYRLYYIDFENKYQDGVGTIYLKADYVQNGGTYKLPISEELTDSSNIPENIKIKNLNPELYKNGTPPSNENYSMKAVAWLTDTNNWKDLINEETLRGIKKEDINYVVGAPSIEMMMDSYNTHYELTDDEKLYCKFPYDDNRFGYAIKPGFYADGFGFQSAPCNPKPDENFYLYNSPGNICYWYWFASPSAANAVGVLYFDDWSNGFIDYDDGHEVASFSPIVSLKTSAKLILEE